MKHLLSSFALSLLSLSACVTDGSDADFEERASEVEGIYRVDSHLMNETACAPGGTPMQDLHGFAFAKRGSIFGTEFLQVWSCESLEDCRQKAAQDQLTSVIDFNFTLSAASGDRLTGTMSTSGYSDGSGTCSMPEMQKVTLELTGDALRIEGRIHIGADYKSDDGICWSDKGLEASKNAPCSQLETLTATLVETL